MKELFEEVVQIEEGYEKKINEVDADMSIDKYTTLTVWTTEGGMICKIWMNPTGDINIQTYPGQKIKVIKVR